MPSLEKQFTISQTIDLSNVCYGRRTSEVVNHFSIPWRMEYYTSNSSLTICMCCLYLNCKEWEIQCKLMFKLKSSNGTTLQLEKERTYRNRASSWGWYELAKLKDIEKYYAENGKVVIEVHLIVKKMSGFGIEKFRNFDQHTHYDVILIIEGRKFHLLKAFLACQSIYFDKLLFGAFKEANQKEVVLKEVNHEDFHSFLELIHGEPAAILLEKWKEKMEKESEKHVAEPIKKASKTSWFSCIRKQRD
ncbi:hypothetical protein CAEBREN_07226 [Caenorhabditis brenneri]|uniref:BTB domain-containing protein n=1 Tax=Caenorhabditis brenneri TaxID=135651 RepID=G0PGZ8_CAEBE|nr:hypothetical protein CAEBREN_07226 [Caenorhabditis brenneri]